MMLDFTAILSQWQLLLDGAELTAKLALVTTVTGFLIGTLCAIARRSQSRVFARVAAIYVESIRNTPFLVQIFLVYFGLSSMGFSFTAFTVSVIALTINVGAYTAEIMRAGFESVHKGQWEAAETPINQMAAILACCITTCDRARLSFADQPVYFINAGLIGDLANIHGRTHRDR